MLAAYAEESSSPLPRSTFAGPYPEVTARLYEELLPVVPHLLTHVEDFQKLCEAEDRALQEGEWLLDGGIVTIEPNPDLDLAIVRVPADVAEPHPMALHTRTPYSRLIVVHGTSVELRYRYESWVQFASIRSIRIRISPNEQWTRLDGAAGFRLSASRRRLQRLGHARRRCQLSLPEARG